MTANQTKRERKREKKTYRWKEDGREKKRNEVKEREQESKTLPKRIFLSPSLSSHQQTWQPLVGGSPEMRPTPNHSNRY